MRILVFVVTILYGDGVVHDVGLSAFIIKCWYCLAVFDEGTTILETSATTLPKTKCHIPEDLIPRQPCCKNL